jgi:hypothetical protein
VRAIRLDVAGLACGAAVAIAGCGLTVTPAGSPEPTRTPTTLPIASGQAGAGRLVDTGRMTVPRAVATATRLLDGRILVAGGCTTDGCDLGSAGGATAELYDPVRGTFGPTGDLTVSRDSHQAVLLSDGRVLLIGGWGATSVLSSTDVYDPRFGTFSPGPTMRTGREGMVPIQLSDGSVLLAGGFIDTHPTTSAAEILDPVSATFSPTGDLTRPRGAYAAARLLDGRVLVAGGISDGVITDTAEIFDPARGEFTPTGSMATPRYKGGALTLPDGRILVFGGSGDIDGTILYDSTELYDPVRGLFTPGPSMTRARYKLADSTIRLASGDYLLTAGAPSPERFSTDSLSFSPIAGSLGATRLFLAAAPIDGERVLLVGGYDRAIRVTDRAWLYDDRG